MPEGRVTDSCLASSNSVPHTLLRLQKLKEYQEETKLQRMHSLQTAHQPEILLNKKSCPSHLAASAEAERVPGEGQTAVHACCEGKNRARKHIYLKVYSAQKAHTSSILHILNPQPYLNMYMR